MLTQKLRAELQKPFGDLCPNASCAEKLKAFSKIVTVGDITTYNVVRAGIVPDISIVDGITMRERVPEQICREIDDVSRVIYKVDNPPGSISKHLHSAVRGSMEHVARAQRTRIVVNGEEDLAVIPVVVEAPLGAAVVYGQPNEGMVIITVTQERKEKARLLMQEILDETAV